MDLVPVSFYDDTLHAVQKDGDVWVSLLNVCECIGADYGGQRYRLNDTNQIPWATTFIMKVVENDGNQRDCVMMNLDTLLMFLATIKIGHLSQDLRNKLIRYQKECAKVLRQHFLWKVTEAVQIDPLEREKVSVAFLGTMDRILSYGGMEERDKLLLKDYARGCLSGAKDSYRSRHKLVEELKEKLIANKQPHLFFN